MACGNFILNYYLKFVFNFFICGCKSIYMACGNVWTRGTMGEFWVNVVTARKAGVAIVHAHKLCNCVQTTIMHNCELCKQGCNYARTHCNCTTYCSAHVIISHMYQVSYFIPYFQDGFYLGFERLIPKYRKAWLHIYVWGHQMGRGVQVGMGVTGRIMIGPTHTTVQMLLLSRILR